MKILSTLLILTGMVAFASAQTTFTIDNIHGSDNEYLSDVQYANSLYYALSIHKESNSPKRFSSSLYIFNDAGQLVNQAQLGEFGYKYFRILSIYHNKIKLVGSIKTDSCSSTLAVSEYDISSGTLTHLAQYTLCEGKYVHSMRIVKGLDDEIFLEAVYSPDEADQTEFNHRTLFFQLASNTINPIPNLEEYESHLSVDFSGKGYIIRWGFVCEYYDRNFNHRYQYNNNTSGYVQELNSFIQPLVNHYLLEHTLFEDVDHSKNEEIRLIDSNLYTKKLAVISPQQNNYGVRLPLYGGLALGSYNSIWTSANFGNQYNPVLNYFSITRLDSDLKIVCDQFIGFDAIYNIAGITAFEDNGAIVYGYKIPYGSNVMTGDKDIFAMKVGQDCELSTTATHSPTETLVSISAYPNPGINDLTFSIHGFDPSSLRVELVDESGKILFTQKDLSNSIRIPQLPAGQYFYRILKSEIILGVGAWVKE